jgi:hypothetical protein
MKNIRHPNFILGLISFIIFFTGIGMRANGLEGGNYVLGASLLLGGIHWIWSIIDVFTDFRVNSGSENRIIWIILVIILPPIGGMLYYTMSKTVRM